MIIDVDLFVYEKFQKTCFRLSEITFRFVQNYELYINVNQR